jgi:hypothetical protein
MIICKNYDYGLENFTCKKTRQSKGLLRLQLLPQLLYSPLHSGLAIGFFFDKMNKRAKKMKRVIQVYTLFSVAVFLLSCGNCKNFDFSSLSCKQDEPPPTPISAQSTCPNPNDTSINGVENKKSTTLDFNGDWKSQVHLETMTSASIYHHVKWDVKPDRQTCSSGSITVEGDGTRNYLLISYNKTMIHMKVIAGLNYIDYTAYGCKTIGDTNCGDVVETGTIVLDVNYVPH